MALQRYDQGSIGMRRDDDGAWCEYEEAQNEINTLIRLIFKYVNTDNVSADDFKLIENIFLKLYKEEDYDVR